MKPSTARAHYHNHTKYWEERRTELRELRNAYMTRYWSQQGRQPQQITVETSRGYEFVEGYIASLFARSPSVIVQGDVRGRGNARKVQALCNNFLSTIRTQIEDASRLALINPCAFIKLLPNENNDPFKRVSVVAIPPWNVIVDTDAGSWNDQKCVAHRS